MTRSRRPVPKAVAVRRQRHAAYAIMVAGVLAIAAAATLAFGAVGGLLVLGVCGVPGGFLLMPTGGQARGR